MMTDEAVPHMSNKARRHLKRKAAQTELLLSGSQRLPETTESGARMTSKPKNKKRKKAKTELLPSSENLKAKKLLILDVNKVLVHRDKGCSHFTRRPFVIDFLREMSKHYELAVWTSMTRSSGKRVLRELFDANNIKLLFAWYQNRCKIIPNVDVDIKPEFFKNLTEVWKEYTSYHAANTLLLDDSIEKCVENDSANCIHPSPYTIENREEFSEVNINSDQELMPEGRLWQYLIKLADFEGTVERFVETFGKYSSDNNAINAL